MSGQLSEYISRAVSAMETLKEELCAEAGIPATSCYVSIRAGWTTTSEQDIPPAIQFTDTKSGLRVVEAAADNIMQEILEEKVKVDNDTIKAEMEIAELEKKIKRIRRDFSIKSVDMNKQKEDK